MAGATDTKLWDAVEDSQATREKEGKLPIGSPDPEVYAKPPRNPSNTKAGNISTTSKQNWVNKGTPEMGQTSRGGPCHKNCEHLRNYCTNHNDLDISRESSSSSASPQKSERRVRETTEIQPQDDRGNSGQANKQVTTSGQRLG
ncbi:hypothetical protein BKA82DRAFT_32374 [Pisolithus tinctorius]|nr:hypothetical protein BKA82DRAFT_32374 [Pisolithus tinctorius]